MPAAMEWDGCIVVGVLQIWKTQHRDGVQDLGRGAGGGVLTNKNPC